MATEKSGTESKHHHIVMFPFMAQGHLIPFLALANIIEQKTGYTITIVNTPLNIQTLKSSLPPFSTIRLASLPFNAPDHGLPPHLENTDSLPFHLFSPLFQASQTLQPSFQNLLSDISKQDARPPLCIIADPFLGWTVETARKLGIFHAVFSTCGGYGTAAYFSMWLHLPHCRTDSDEFHVPGFPDSFRLRRSQLSAWLRAAEDADPWSVILKKEMLLSLGSDGMLCHAVEEVEKTGLEALRKISGLQVWSIGPLLPSTLISSSSSSSSTYAGKRLGISVDACVSWLNLQSPSSVLYVAFGSQNTISASQMKQLAIGLEASGRNFIWVVRPPIGNDMNGEFRADQWLPEGFEERVAERKQGVVVRKWAPQMEILAHESTGAFLSHCGWNSVVESLSNGVPVIGWPLASEQFYNSKVMEEEMGVCVEIARGSGGEIYSGRVAEVIEMVMGETERGKEMRRNAGKVREKMRAAMTEKEGERRGSSVRALEDFIATALSKA